MNANFRKAQGMPINVIIIAVLALIVLVVIAAIFTGRVRIFSQNLESCAAKQGHCDSKCGSNYAVVTNTNCPETEQDKKDNKNTKNLCCVQVLNS